ncbi:hypothetical protein [Actinomadura sp. 6N118]|uniref:hypothetical protein n=1 Tax=Actinomadura sp. 6N118 TaxID=3375151 RepID=UPI00378A7807
MDERLAVHVPEVDETTPAADLLDQLPNLNDHLADPLNLVIALDARGPLTVIRPWYSNTT